MNIKRIEFVGNLHNKDLSKYLNTKVGTNLDSAMLTSDLNLIQAKYAENGFFWAEVNHRVITKSKGLVLRWEIKENTQAQTGTIEITGNKSILTSTLIGKLKFRHGAFTKQKVENNIENLLQIYSDSGFAFCQIEPKNFQISDSSVSYLLKITEGPKVIIKGIEFTGFFATNPEVLKRILGLGTNWLYSETELQTGLRRLEKTNLFDILKYDIIERDDEYFLQTKINEKKSNEIQGAFAYLPKTDERPAEYSGFALVNIKNLLGTLREVKGSWSKFGTRTIYELAYVEPYLLGLGMKLGAEIGHEIRDTTYARTNFNLSSEIAIQDVFTLRFETGYELIIPGIASFDRSETYWAGNGISLDNRDKPTNPRRGFYAKLTNRIGSKTVKYQEAQLLAKSYFDSEIVLPLSRNFNFTFLLNGRNLYSSDTVNFYDLFYLGGAKSLRGYKEEAFASNRLFWLNNELRWLIGNESRIFPFFDIGVYLKEHRYESKLGYGLGLRVWSKIGLFGIDYGLAFGENFLNGKVHLSLTTQF